MTQEHSKWLRQPLHYTEAINEWDQDGSKRAAAESAITVQLSAHFLEYCFVEHTRAILDCIQEHFPRLPEEPAQTTQERDQIVVALLFNCLYPWHDSVADHIRPSEAEATEGSRELVLLGLSLLFPHLVEVVSPPAEEVRPPLKGTLRRYIVTPMHMTLMIRTEDGQEVTLALDGDTLLWLFGDYARVSNLSFASTTQKLLDTSADKITCDIEYGHITRTIVEKDGVVTEE